MPNKEIQKLKADIIPKPKKERVKSTDGYDVRESTHISKEAFRRIANRAGAKTISGAVFEELRGHMRVFVNHVIKKTAIIVRYKDRSVIQAKDVAHVLENMNLTIYDTDEHGRLKKCDLFHPSKKQKQDIGIERIKFYQKQADCVLIEPAVFTRHIQIITRDDVDNLKWSPSALNIMQIATEHFLHDLISAAMLCMIHANRVTLQPKDLWLVAKIRNHKILYD